MNGYLGKPRGKRKKKKRAKEKPGVIIASTTVSYINTDNTGELVAMKDSIRPSNLNGFLSRFYEK